METSTETTKGDGKSGAKERARPTGNASIVELRGVTKIFYRGKEELHVLQGIDLDVVEGSFEALMGPSGSGKSTLLNLIAGLDRPSAGSARVANRDLSSMSDGELAKFRASTVGFIFQAYNLMPVLTARENVELPLLLTNLSSGERKKRALTALRVVGLEDRVDHYPRQLSGGQEQRVAIARAIVNDPKIIVADEPTGDLDRKSADDILHLLEELNREFKKTILMVTHDSKAAERATVLRRLDKGVLL
jgi:putative ABC transport system ATP-binding protein